MTLLNRIESTTKLWTIILPNFPAPQPPWVGRLCKYPDSAIEEGIVRASKKFSPDRVGKNVTPEDVWKNVSGTVRAIAEHHVLGNS
jgi:hypothetical protein